MSRKKIPYRATKANGKPISRKAALDRIQELASRISHKICCYSHRDYAMGKPPDWMCDCKYLLTPEGTAYPSGWDGTQQVSHIGSEQTGCCEAREIVDMVRRLRFRV